MRMESIIDHGENGTDRTNGTHAAARRLRGVVILLVLGIGGAGLGAQAPAGRLLPDGVVLTGLDGMLLRTDANDVWWFELTADTRGDRYRLPAGTRLVLLPSGTLEHIVADVNDRYTPHYRLIARVTQYGGANFLLPTYFLPLSKFKGDEPVDEGEQTTEDAAADLMPDDPELDVPPEILERLRTRRPVRGPLRSERVPRPPAPVYFDRMIVDRIGLIEAKDVEAVPDARIHACTLPRLHFIPYALGWNVSEVRYELLPSRALEQALQMQRNSLDPMRFDVAGLVTRFQGRQYLLLQRVLPVYNYGNFSR
jgi:hypothetical protein